MRKIYRKLFLSLIIVGLLSISCLSIQALSGTKTTFDNKNNTINTFYNVFNDFNDIYLINGPFICLLSSNRIKCTGSSSASSISKLEYEIIGSDSYLASKESYWLNDSKDNNTAYIVDTQLNEELKSSLNSSRASVYVKDDVTYSGSGTRIDPFTFNEPKTNAEDINLVAFYIDTDGDGEYEDEVEVEGKKGFVKFVPTEENYNLDISKTKCLDIDGIEHGVRYTDSDKTIAIVNATKQISCTIGLTKITNSSKWENICFANGILKSSRLNCKILADNRKCTNELGVCPDNTNADPFLNTTTGEVEFDKISSNTNGKGLYYTAGTAWNKSSDVDADGENDEVYYFRGDVTNNYVQFAGTLWRIIRIDERGNIRMMKDEINTSAPDYKTTWNTEANASYKMKMSFMYGTSTSSPYTPTNNSTIKMALDRIYTKNFSQSENQTWEDFLADPGYCNDKSGDKQIAISTADKEEVNTTYTNRTIQPTYKCEQASDNYTTKTSSFGNKADNYLYPIGIITYDEVVFAGGTTGENNSSFYLYKPNEYWTLTPSQYNYECQYKVSNATLTTVSVHTSYRYCAYSSYSQYRDGCNNTQNNIPLSCVVNDLDASGVLDTSDFAKCNCKFGSYSGLVCPYYSKSTTCVGTTYSFSYFQNYEYYTVSNKINNTMDGKIHASSAAETNSKYIYPVIALKPTVVFTLASETNPGTKDNPYVVGPPRTWNDGIN